MQKFSVREQILIIVAIFSIFSLVATWGIKHLNSIEKIMHVKLDELDMQIKQIQNLSNELKKLQQKSTAPIMTQSLSSFVEKVARSIGIQDNLQLNVLTNVENNLEGIRVGLDSLNIDHLLSMLYQLENHRPILKVSHLNITISPGERKIRTSFQVKKQKSR